MGFFVFLLFWCLFSLDECYFINTTIVWSLKIKRKVNPLLFDFKLNYFFICFFSLNSLLFWMAFFVFYIVLMFVQPYSRLPGSYINYLFVKTEIKHYLFFFWFELIHFFPFVFSHSIVIVFKWDFLYFYCFDVCLAWTNDILLIQQSDGH